MSVTDDQPLALHRKEAAKKIGISLTSLDRAIAAGKLKAKKYGKRTLLLVPDIERFVDELPDQPPSNAKPRTRKQK
jgi:hypothetical protein